MWLFTHRAGAVRFGGEEGVIVFPHLLDLIHQGVDGVLRGLARQEQADALAHVQVGLRVLQRPPPLRSACLQHGPMVPTGYR